MEHYCKLILGIVSGCVKLPYLLRLFVCVFCSGVFFSCGITPLINFVIGIVLVGSQKQMRGIDARLGTHKENIHEAIAERNGIHWSRGILNKAAKLNPKQVKEIRQACLAGKSQASQARKYGVAAMQISRCVRRLTWRHVA